MTDFFVLLDETRRPWLDTSELKQKFLTLSTSLHPDRVHSASEVEKENAAKKFTDLNIAYNHLIDPKLRLFHLLELETGTKPKDIQQIPDDLADLFAGVAANCSQIDKFLKDKPQNASPLLAVQWFERVRERMEQLEQLKNKLGVLRGRLDDELKLLDTKWMSSETAGRKEILPQLERLYRLFGYFNRWNNQIQERIVQIAL